MKLTKPIITVLKNFSVINESIYISEINCLKTISTAGNIIGIFDLEESFPIQFAIYNLSSFLSVINLFDLNETDFDFKDKFVLITYKNNKIKYAYTEPKLIKGYDTLKSAEIYKNFDKFDASFELTTDQITTIKKSGSIMDLSKMKIIISDSVKKIELTNQSFENTNQNYYEIQLETATGNGEILVDISTGPTRQVSSLEIINGNYEISFITNKMLKFKNKDAKLIYFVAANI